MASLILKQPQLIHKSQDIKIKYGRFWLIFSDFNQLAKTSILASALWIQISVQATSHLALEETHYTSILPEHFKYIFIGMHVTIQWKNEEGTIKWVQLEIFIIKVNTHTGTMNNKLALIMAWDSWEISWVELQLGMGSWNAPEWKSFIKSWWGGYSITCTYDARTCKHLPSL